MICVLLTDDSYFYLSSRNTDIQSSTRSDFSSYGHFIWGYLNCNVFVNCSWTASETEQNIGEDVDEILMEIF